MDTFTGRALAQPSVVHRVHVAKQSFALLAKLRFALAVQSKHQKVVSNLLQSSFRQGRCKSNVYLITITPTANCKAKLCKNPGHFVFVQSKNRGNKARLCLICFPSCILIDTPFRGSLRGRLTPHGFTRCGKPRTSGDPDSH